MTIAVRFAIALALSLAVGGAIQQWIMMTFDSGGAPDALPPLGVCILLITAVFGLVMWRRASAIGLAAAIILAVMLVFGVAVYAFGVNVRRAGLGGNISYLMAMLVVFYFLLPTALAVPIHWLMLRGPH
jgi:hypothetical protein